LHQKECTAQREFAWGKTGQLRRLARGMSDKHTDAEQVGEIIRLKRFKRSILQ